MLIDNSYYQLWYLIKSFNLKRYFTLIMKFIRIIGLTITVFNKSTFYIIISKFNELNFQIIVRLKLIHFGLKKLWFLNLV